MRVAFFTPLPPSPSGIADYSAQLLPALAPHMHLQVFHEGATNWRPPAGSDMTVRPVADFRTPLQECVDLCVYQMGNNLTYHSAIFGVQQRTPGVTVLHDLSYNDFFGSLYLLQGNLEAYTRELGMARGVHAVERVGLAHAGLVPYDTRPRMLDRLVLRSLGVVVHSHFAKRLVTQVDPSRPVRQIQQPVPLSAWPEDGPTAKAALGLPPDTCLIGSFGYAAPAKRLMQALRAFARLAPDHPTLHYAVVGRVVEGYDLVALVDSLGIGQRVHLVGYADADLYARYLAATDIGVNLRFPSTGETSATLLDLMAAGKPALVSEADAFVELPDEICLKIPVDHREEERLVVVLRRLVDDPAARRRLGEAARSFVRRACDPAVVAADYADFLRGLVRRERSRLRSIAFDPGAGKANSL